MAENNEEQKYKLTFDTNAKKVLGETNALGASIEHTTDATNENNAAVSAGNEQYKTFKTQLREANQELQKSIQLYGETSEETIKAAKAVAGLKDQMGFAKDLADNFNPDQKMKALGAATQVAGTGLQGVTAGMALFGGESADTQKQLLKVQAAMAFSDAISQMSNLGDQWQLLKATISASSVATKANAAATGTAAMIQNLFTGSVNTSSAGFKGLKLAIAGTGIGLLVVGLALVITNFSKIKDVVLKVVPGLAVVGEVIGSIVDGITDFIGVTSEAERTIDRMKESADASLLMNKKFLAEHGSQLDEFTKQKIAAKDKYSEAIKEDGANQKALASELNRELAAIEYSRGDESRKIAKENAEKAADEEKERKQKAKDDAEKERQKEIEERKTFLEKANAIEEEFSNLKIEKEQKEKDRKQKEFEAGLEAQAERAKNESDVANNAAEETKRRNDAVFQQEEAIQNAKLSLANQAINLFGEIFGKSKKAQKAALITSNAVGLAEVVINTQKAVSADMAVPFGAGLPKVPIDIASGALGAASIIAATARGLKELGGGSAGSSPNISGISGGGQIAPTVAFNNTAENQIGQSVSNTQAQLPPIKVYVAESDISDAQNSVKVLVSKNTI